MVVSQWLERGLGQLLAPDETYAPDPDALDTRSAFWNVVAPDPRFSDEKKESGESVTFQSPQPFRRTVGSTPAGVSAASSGAAVAFTPMSSSSLLTAARAERSGNDAGIAPELIGRVITAAVDTNEAMISPPLQRRNPDRLFSFCTAETKPSEKSAQKIRSLLEQDPDLLNARSYGNKCPDGYTLLQAAACQDNVDVAEIIWEKAVDINNKDEKAAARHILSPVNLTGQEALHIAARNGSLGMIEFLVDKRNKHLDREKSAPVDLSGATPLRHGLTSPNYSAKKKHSQLRDALYSTSDPSILGTPAPAQQRGAVIAGLKIAYGFGNMPGERFYDEDAMVMTCFDTQHGQVALFAVCDGHDDGGKVSKFVVECWPKHMKSLLESDKNSNKGEDVWRSLCQQVCTKVDEELKANKSLNGGTTAVLAMVTRTEVIVANVGDSRCILVQDGALASPAETGLEASMEKLKLTSAESEEQEKALSQQGDHGGTDKAAIDPLAAAAAEKSGSDMIVTALSEDHKPDLPNEKARIESAGLKVSEESYTDKDGTIHRISKVELSEDQKVGFSRSFGDYEYKANADLPADKQAVVSVPDVFYRLRSDNDLFLVVGCDGIWDVMSNENCGRFVADHVERLSSAGEGTSGRATSSRAAVLATASSDLVKECHRLGSGDNMSVIVVALTGATEKLVPMQGKALDYAEIRA